MLIHNKKLSIVPLTTHTSLKKVTKLIKKQLIIRKMNTLREDYKKIFDKDPKIAVLGLNPHNAELIKNSEEIKIINPAIKSLKKRGLKVNGPFSLIQYLSIITKNLM